MRFRVPAGTLPKPCASCGKAVYWITHEGARGKSRIPVSIDEKGWTPNQVGAGEGISHFADCPNAAQHRRGRKP